MQHYLSHTFNPNFCLTDFLLWYLGTFLSLHSTNLLSQIVQVVPGTPYWYYIYEWILKITSYLFLKAGFDVVHQASVTIYKYKHIIRPLLLTVPVVKGYPPPPSSITC